MESCKISNEISPRTRTDHPKIHMEPQKSPICQRNLEKKKKKEQDWRYYPLILIYRATVIRTVWY